MNQSTSTVKVQMNWCYALEKYSHPNENVEKLTKTKQKHKILQNFYVIESENLQENFVNGNHYKSIYLSLELHFL